MMTSDQFVTEIEGVARDSIRERQSALDDPLSLGLNDMKRAFYALKDHKDGLGDLFEHTEAPTDEALTIIFAFLVLP